MHNINYGLVSNIEIKKLSESNYNKLFNYDSIRLNQTETEACLACILNIGNSQYMAFFPLGDIDQNNPSGIGDDAIRLFENVEAIDWGYIQLTKLEVSE